MSNLRVDAEGVPKLVQGLHYEPPTRFVTVTFFNGMVHTFMAHDLDLPLYFEPGRPNKEDLQEMERKVEDLVLPDWAGFVEAIPSSHSL